MTEESLTKKVPRSVALELSYRCNNSCIFCSCPWEADKNFIQRELTTEEWKTVINKAVSLGSNNVTLTGGEPLIRSDIREILDFIGTHEGITNKRLITNSLLLTDDVLAMLKKYNFAFSTSLPGVKTYRKLTGTNGAEQVLRWIKRASDLGLNVTTGITVTKLNKFELYETIASALLAGSKTILLNRFLPGGRGLKHRKQLELNRSDVNEMLTTAEEVLSISKRQGLLGTEIPYCAIDKPEQFKQIRFGHICSAAKGFYVTDPSGYVRTCNHSPVRVGTLDDFHESKYWHAFRERAYLPASCSGCEIQDLCDAGCREVAHICKGSIFSDDPLREGVNEVLKKTE